MTDQRLTDELASHALGWRKAPGRYLTSGRSWIPESRFRPLADVRDAFRVLDAVTGDYSLVAAPGGAFKVVARVNGRIGRAIEKSKSRAICAAVAQLIGIKMDQIPNQASRNKQ